MAALADTNATKVAKLDVLAGGGARSQHRAFNSSDRQRRGDRSRYRYGAGIGRSSDQRFGVTLTGL